jgi:hypothetical protein
MAALRSNRFVVAAMEIRAVSRTDSSYEEKAKDGEPKKTIYVYSLEVFLYDRGSIYVDYDDKAERDGDFEAVAGMIT